MVGTGASVDAPPARHGEREELELGSDEPMAAAATAEEAAHEDPANASPAPRSRARSPGHRVGPTIAVARTAPHTCAK